MLIILFFILDCVSAGIAVDSGTRILTVGYGTFAIIVGFIIAFLITFFVGRTTIYPEWIFICSLIIPAILILFFSVSPK